MDSVSFTVRRPAPSSRQPSSDADSNSFRVPDVPERKLSNLNTSSKPSPKKARLAFDSDEEEDNDTADELVTGFDKLGAQRLKPLAKSTGPLVIPALKDSEWREDMKRKARGVPSFVPDSGKVATGADGSQGGLGTRETINSGPEKVGLVTSKKRKVEDMEDIPAEVPSVPPKEETEDELALRALLKPEEDDSLGVKIDVIPMSGLSGFTRPQDETDAFRQDVVQRPESSTLDDYERVPVSQFGAALLRGMGWKEGSAASRTRKGPVKPWTPEARPALLGLGAKEREVLDDGSHNQKRPSRPDKTYMPLVRREREPSSASSSRPRSRSPSHSSRDHRSSKDGYRSKDDHRSSRDDYRSSRDEYRSSKDDYRSSRDDRERRREESSSETDRRDRYRERSRERGSSRREESRKEDSRAGHRYRDRH